MDYGRADPRYVPKRRRDLKAFQRGRKQSPHVLNHRVGRQSKAARAPRKLRGRPPGLDRARRAADKRGSLGDGGEPAEEPRSAQLLIFGGERRYVPDPTVIRALLVPARLRVFGKANWWMPMWTKPSCGTRHVFGICGTPCSIQPEASGSGALPPTPPRKPPTGHGRGAFTPRARCLHRARTIVGTHQGVLLVHPPIQPRRVIRVWPAATPLRVTWTSAPWQGVSCWSVPKPA